MVILEIQYHAGGEEKIEYEVCPNCNYIIFKNAYIDIVVRLKEDVIVLRYHADCIKLINFVKQID